MTYLIYRDYTIVSTAVYDVVSGKWKLSASVISPEDGSTSRQLHFFRNSPELFSRFEDAEKAGMEAAKNWVDLVQQGSPFLPAILPRRPVIRH